VEKDAREEKNRILFDTLVRIGVSDALKSEISLLPSKEELDRQYKPSDKLTRRIKTIIIRNRVKQRIHAYSKMASRVAVLLIILLSVSSITLLSVEATRNAIFNAIIEKYDKYTEIRFDNKVEDGNSNKPYSPTYLPQGFKETSTVTYGNSLMQIYTNDEGLEILFKQGPSETGTILIDNENTEYEEIEINGKVAYLFEALTLEDYNILLWQEEGIVFGLQSLISSDELIQIGRSISR